MPGIVINLLRARGAWCVIVGAKERRGGASGARHFNLARAGMVGMIADKERMNETKQMNEWREIKLRGDGGLGHLACQHRLDMHYTHR
jgi:hypothetical protein